MVEEGSFQSISPDAPESVKKNDVSNEIQKASGIGKLVLKTANERMNPTRVRKYSMPMLDSQQFPRAAVELVTGNYRSIDGQDIDPKVIRGASVALVIEANAQIFEAKNKSSGVAENSDSLNQVYGMIKQGAHLLDEIVLTDREIVIEAARPALAKRGSGNDHQRLSDDQIVEWTRKMSMGASVRVKRLLEIVSNYRY